MELVKKHGDQENKRKQLNKEQGNTSPPIQGRVQTNAKSKNSVDYSPDDILNVIDGKVDNIVIRERKNKSVIKDFKVETKKMEQMDTLEATKRQSQSCNKDNKSEWKNQQWLRYRDQNVFHSDSTDSKQEQQNNNNLKIGEDGEEDEDQDEGNSKSNDTIEREVEALIMEDEIDD